MGPISRLLAGKKKRELPWTAVNYRNLLKRVDLKRPVADAGFVAFDTELTGLDFRNDSLISIGAVRMQGGVIMPDKAFYELVRPESELKGDSVVVHGITHADLAQAAPAAQVIGKFLDFAGDSVLVGHCVHIDLNFVNRAMKREFGFPLRNAWVDTRGLHEWLYKNDSQFARHHMGMTMESDLYVMARRYGIPVDSAKEHNALYDAYLTAQLFQRFLPFLSGCGINTLEELVSVGKTDREGGEIGRL